MAPEEGPTPETARSLVVWGGGSAPGTRARHRDGSEVIAWPGADPTALVRSAVPVRPVEAVIGDAGLAAARAAGRSWARLWGRVPLLDGKSFRDLVTWRDTSLLWLAEGFIRSETAGPRCAEMAEIALSLLEAFEPAEVDALGLGPAELAILSRACTSRGVLFHGRSPRVRPLRPASPRSRPGLGALARALAPGQPPPPPAPWVSGPGDSAPLLLVPDRESDASPLRPLLEAAGAELARPGLVVPATSLSRWQTRRVRGDAGKARAGLRDHWKRLRDAPGVLESYRHRDVGFSDLAGDDLKRLMLEHLPAAVLRLEAAVELIATAVRPAVVILTGGRRDGRRTWLTACALAGVPAIVVHTAPVEPEELDRADGGPRAGATMVWEPGSEPAPVLVRLGELARARVGRA